MATDLRISNISKIYPGCVANDNVSLQFKSGKIYAYIFPLLNWRDTLSLATHPGYIFDIFDILKSVAIAFL